ASQRSPFGRTSVYAYAPQGVTVVSDAEAGGARNAFVHDRRANLTAMVDANGRAMRMRYDTRGHMVGYTDRRGSVFEIAWNKEGTRPLRRTGPHRYDAPWAGDGHDRVRTQRPARALASLA